MPAAPLPPMTSRQAKKLYKKAPAAQWSYSASQMRAADRRDELDRRRRDLEDKEQRLRVNKRKREDKEDKERVTKRKLLEEGKLSVEDMWGKVTASQPRLNNFFAKPPVVAKLHQNHSLVAEERCENEAAQIRRSPIIPPQDTLDAVTEPQKVRYDHLCDADVISPHLQRHMDFQAQTDLDAPECTHQAQNHHCSPRPSSMAEQNRPKLQSPFRRSASSASQFDFDFAEDETAQSPRSPSKLEPLMNVDAEHFATPPKSLRSPLSELSPAKVNNRAKEISTKSESQASRSNRQTSCVVATTSLEDELAMICTQDLIDDDCNDGVEAWDKENLDPSFLASQPSMKKNLQPATNHDDSQMPTKPTLAPPIGFGNFDDCEDLFDFDNPDEDDESFDDGLDDTTLLSMLSTQKVRTAVIITEQGSPKKPASEATHERTAILNPSTTATEPPGAPEVVMPPPKSPLTSRRPTRPTSIAANSYRSSFTKTKSFGGSFDSIDDDDLIDLAEHVEVEIMSGSTRPGKSRRRLPWEVNPLPPPSTQDCMLALVEELEAT